MNAWVVVVVAALGSGCGEPRRPPPAPPTHRVVVTVTSAAVMNACPDARRLDPKRATREIDELIGPCTKVPGGTAHFSATLRPDGRIELASPTGDASEGVVPTCVVQSARQLRHRLRLRSPCTFDVRLESHAAR